MNNVYKKHHIEYLSSSTVNMFIYSPAKCMMKLAGYSGQVGSSAWRGSGVDVALCNRIKNPKISLEECKRIAHNLYDQEVALAKKENRAEADWKIDKEREIMNGCIDQGELSFVTKYRDKKVIDTQGKLEMMLDDIAVPYIGYYDILFEDRVVDLKSKGAQVSAPSNSDQRQVSFYAYATGREPWLAYLSKKELREFKVSNPKNHVENLRQAIFALEKILSFSDDIIECCQLVYPNFDDWMFSETDKINAHKIWRIK